MQRSHYETARRKLILPVNVNSGSSNIIKHNFCIALVRYLLSYLDSFQVPTHSFMKSIDDRILFYRQ